MIEEERYRAQVSKGKLELGEPKHWHTAYNWIVFKKINVTCSFSSVKLGIF